MTGHITSSHRGIGNMLGRLHDQAQRDSIVLSNPIKRRCWYGNHSARNIGGSLIGGKWACAKCKGVVA